MRSYFLKGLLIFVSICCNVGSSLTYASTSATWELTEAKVEIPKENINNLNLENTVIAVLIQATGKPLNVLLEKDKITLISFVINYDALDNRKIRQRKLNKLGYTEI
jgi:hypothetical protein